MWIVEETIEYLLFGDTQSDKCSTAAHFNKAKQ